MPDWTELLLILLDTNTLVSALLAPAGNEARVIALARQRKIAIAYSSGILEEYERVLHKRKFKFDATRVEELLNVIRRSGFTFSPNKTLRISPHEADNRFLECAEAAQADFLITGNLRHFPASHGLTRIVNARTFLDEFEPKS